MPFKPNLKGFFYQKQTHQTQNHRTTTNNIQNFLSQTTKNIQKTNIFSQKKCNFASCIFPNMKPYKITLFIFVTIGILTCICAAYPNDGITIGNTKLNFPTISEMLAVNTPTQQSDSNDDNSTALKVDSQMLLLDSLQQIAIAPYLKFFQEAPNRIFFPNNDITFFDPLYASLENARRVPMRIVHYGDSQIEEDRLTKELRLELQTRFGGSGVGLLPFVQNITSLTTRQNSTSALTRKMAYGPTSYRSADKIYGPLMRMDILNTPVTTTISSKIADNNYNNPAYHFTKVTVLARPVNNPIKLKLTGNKTDTLQPSAAQMQTATFTYDSTTQVSVSASGYGYMYGIMLDDTVGVSVDNIPMRGCSGTIFTYTDPTTMRQYYKMTNTKLIIMQFTGNSVPYLSGQKSITAYVNKIRNQIRFMQNLAPDAAILFIGPSDMLQSKDGNKTSYPLLPAIDRQMRQAVNEEGAAYWSIFLSMGGSGSMTKWAQSNPPLAAKDGIHFTRLGAHCVGELLTQSIIQGYRYYTIRNEYYQTIAERELDSLCTE